MDSRERVIRAIEFTGPDRIPVMHRTLPGAFRRYGRKLEELYAKYPSDVLLSPTLQAPFSFLNPASEGAGAGLVTDIWGCTHHKITDDYHGYIVSHPLDDWRKLEDYQFPDPMLGREGSEELIEAVARDGHRHYVIAAADTIYHRYCFLRGMENALMDVAEESELFKLLLDRITDFVVARVEFWCKFAEVDGILVSDDWGTQQNLLINPTSWRKWFQPAYRRVVEAIHAGGAYAHFHTDGHTRAIIPDLIEIGFDEVNPQVWVMDVQELGQAFAGQACFRADLDRQAVLPWGSVADVAAHVRQTYQALGRPSGGYIGYGQIGPDVPLANAEAMLRTFTTLRLER
jgi:uroporphyrinogen-III decarboxylase